MFTLFQICNAATANYGFFCYLAAALNVFLLDDADVERAGRKRRGSCRPRSAAAPRAFGFGARPASRSNRGESPLDAGDDREMDAAAAGAALFVLVSLTDALYAFTEPGRALAVVAPLFELNQRFRLVNSYHLFASITRERIEPELQTLAAGTDAAVPTRRALPGRRTISGTSPAIPGARPTSWRRTSRASTSSSGSTASRFVAASRLTSPRWSSECARIPPPCSPCFASRSRRTRRRPHRLLAVPFASRAERRATGAWWRRARVAMSRAVLCPGGNQ